MSRLMTVLAGRQGRYNLLKLVSDAEGSRKVEISRAAPFLIEILPN